MCNCNKLFLGKVMSNTVKRESFAGRKFGEFGESPVIRQTKTIQIIIITIDNPLADLFIRQTFFTEKSKLAKHSAHQTFPLYGK